MSEHALTLAGQPVVLRAAGTLWVPQHDTLVVADLHLEKGSAYAARGQLLPPYDTRETLNRLINEVRQTQAARIVLLGDSLHDMDAIARIPVAEREAVIDLARTGELVWISGNHDPDGGSAFGGTSTEQLSLGALVLRHEPSQAPAHGEVAGHLHPCAKIIGTGGAVRRPCFISDGQRMILPAFGAYTGGLNVRDVAFGSLFAADKRAYMLGARITPIAYGRTVPDNAVARRALRRR